ncbi:MAG: YggS family pyridoxal phosphate-dependent enzyme [Polyangiaceae bacterium]
MSTIAERLDAVRTRIREAAQRAGRPESSVRLVAVSKTKPPEAIREAYAAGQREFGENYVQELSEKAEALADLPGISWHMIGHLQRNKAKRVVELASWIHTVDSSRLAQELGKRAIACARSALPVLVEVNVGGESQKSGCAPGELGALLETVEGVAGLRLAGLMTVPPHTDDPAGALPFFERLRAARDAFGGAARLPELSMGMTHDLEQAIVAGATWVRIGTAIFGERR